MNKSTTQKLSKLDTVIEMTHKKLELLKELKNSIKYEASTYRLDRITAVHHQLVNIKTNEVELSGSPAQVVKKIDLRGIDEEDIYYA